MPKVTVDGIEIEVPQGATVLQASLLERRINENKGAKVLEAAE